MSLLEAKAVYKITLFLTFGLFIFASYSVSAKSELLSEKAMGYSECISYTENVIASMNVSPDRILQIVNTDILRITKILADDGNILVTCSKPDNKMTLIKS